MMKRRVKHQYQRAFSLLEVLLAVGIMATILAIGTVITTDLARQIVNEKAADQMLTLQRAGEEYATANFSKLLSSSVAGNIANNGNSRLVTVATLKDDGFLPNNFDEENLLNLDMAVFVRNSSPTGALPAIEVVTVTSPTPSTNRGQTYEWILDTALFGNGKLGILSNIGAGFNNISFTSTNGSWNVPVSNLSGYSPTLPTASTDPSGYIAAYGRVTAEDVFDPNVLYRIPIAGQPGLNQMQAPLNMNNNGLVDVSTLTAEQINANNVNIASTGRYALSSTGTMDFGTGATSMSGDVVVYGRDPSLGSSLTAGNANLGAGGLTAETISTDVLEAGANGLVARDINATNVNSQDLIANNSLALSVDNLNTSNIQIGGGSGATTLTTGGLTANNLVAGEANVTNAMTVVNDGMSVVNNMNIGGNATVRSLSVAGEANLTDLCFTSGAQDEIDGC